MTGQRTTSDNNTFLLSPNKNTSSSHVPHGAMEHLDHSITIG